MTVTLVTWIGEAVGARVAAAALACARSEPDRAGMVIELGARRPPRPTLLASNGARALEERLAVHLPEAGVASRGWVCHLTLPADGDGIQGIAAALPLADDSVVHVPPRLFRAALDLLRPGAGGVLLRADLGTDRAHTALVARDAMECGLQVAVLKAPLGWLASRRALLGVLSAGSGGGLSERICDRLLGRSTPVPASTGGGEPRMQFRL